MVIISFVGRFRKLLLLGVGENNVKVVKPLVKAN
jgi:hypothetical protein